MDRIPIATKGGKTAAGKDQIIHYTQQQGGKVISDITQPPGTNQHFAFNQMSQTQNVQLLSLTANPVTIPNSGLELFCTPVKNVFSSSS